MTPRRVFVTLEVTTDALVNVLRDKHLWQGQWDLTQRGMASLHVERVHVTCDRKRPQKDAPGKLTPAGIEYMRNTKKSGPARSIALRAPNEFEAS